MQIGSFFRTAKGYEGIIETATLDIRISIVPAEQSDADKAPDWRVHRGDGGEGPEIGAGWNESGERAGNYVSLRIDDPAFAGAMRLYVDGEVANSAEITRESHRAQRTMLNRLRWAFGYFLVAIADFRITRRLNFSDEPMPD